MEIKLKYDRHYTCVFCGVFVESSQMLDWIKVASELKRGHVSFYPIPGNTPNSVSGALLIVDQLEPNSIEQYTKVYRIGGAFYLLEGSILSPKLNASNLQSRFGEKPHFFHPTYGLMELTELTDWSKHTAFKHIDLPFLKPENGPHYIESLGAYYIREIPPEKVLEALIAKSVPNRTSQDSKPLSRIEKIKLKFYNGILGKAKSEAEKNANDQLVGTENEQSVHEKSSWWKQKRKQMEEHRDNLEERNKKELDKLMDMLRKNPDEALKYALPIDRSGYSRGPEVGFTMQQRWGRGYQTGATSTSGGSVNLDQDRETALRDKYNQIARDYIEKKEWGKASFVYLELLSNPTSAGEVLEKGGEYEAAAAIFLTKAKNQMRAAQCYENGKFYGKAIDLYEELDWQLKVGDLYAKLGNTKKSRDAYHKEVDKLVRMNNYIAAGNISSEKLKSTPLARQHYFKGWEIGNQPNECLTNYLNTFDEKLLRKEIQNLHAEQYDGRMAHRFLDVLKDQVKKDNSLKNDVEIIFYETIARNAKDDHLIVDHLSRFNESALTNKDIARFKKWKH